MLLLKPSKPKIPVPVADGDRTPEVQSVDPDVHELPRRGDGTGVPGEAQFPHVRRQGAVGFDPVEPLFHTRSSLQTIFPPTMVSLQTP